MKKILLSMLLAIPLFAFANMDSNSVKISDLDLKKTPNGVYILKGIATNTSSQMLDSVIITYSAYNNGLKVQESPATTSKLKPGERWLFDLMLVPPFDEYKLQNIEVFVR